MKLGRAHKFRAVRTEVDGHSFPSKAEARRYAELKLRERIGEIRGLELQPIFPLIVNGRVLGKYIADFRYFEGESTVVEDVKGMKTPLYRLKKKIVEALYSVKIVEVGA